MEEPRRNPKESRVLYLSQCRFCVYLSKEKSDSNILFQGNGGEGGNAGDDEQV